MISELVIVIVSEVMSQVAVVCREWLLIREVTTHDVTWLTYVKLSWNLNRHKQTGSSCIPVLVGLCIMPFTAGRRS